MKMEKKLNKSYFITFEGGECSGKSTVINEIAKKLKNEGYEVLITREPGGSEISEKIRKFILDKENKNITYETEALLFAASRSQFVKEILKPALSQNIIILCDRYIDSSFAYQGYGRGLGLKNIENINSFAMQYMPNLTLFLDIAPTFALKRIAGRKKSDRLDNESFEFHNKVYEGYLDIMKKYPNRIKRINASEAKNEVINACYNEIINILK